MEYIYAALLLHKAGQKIDEANLSKVLEAANIKPELTRAKALVAALEGVDIDKAIKEAAVQQVAVAAAPAGGGAAGGAGGKHEAKPEAKKEDEKKSAEESAAGLSAMFG